MEEVEKLPNEAVNIRLSRKGQGAAREAVPIGRYARAQVLPYFLSEEEEGDRGLEASPV